LTPQLPSQGFAMSTRPPMLVSRRRFLQTTAAASALFAAPYFVPQRAFGANERVNLGFVGCKNRGMQNMEGFKIVGKDAGKMATNCAAVSRSIATSWPLP